MSMVGYYTNRIEFESFFHIFRFILYCGVEKLQYYLTLF